MSARAWTAGVRAVGAMYLFVEPEDLLGELRAALARAARGHGGLVTLTGAAGAGRARPVLGTVPRHRVDATPTGLVLEFEERWEGEQGAWYCRELMRGEIRDGALSELSVYCAGDWSPDVRAAYAREVTLLRP
ncbi:hypothetical protein [Streptomyces sp. NPDC017958]|uniref:hypothetical protein n=1 Tax=Streptomyces sp. NPDC017958 TaxID=3365021 RepID=UPI0037BCE133